MSTQHTPTPGPWTVDGAGTRAIVRGADLTIVAVRHRLAGGIHEANCYQIAAAPEMLEALKLALKALDAISDEMTTGERYTNAGQYLIDALDPVRAALAKAEGKS